MGALTSRGLARGNASFGTWRSKFFSTNICLDAVFLHRHFLRSWKKKLEIFFSCCFGYYILHGEMKKLNGLLLKLGHLRNFCKKYWFHLKNLLQVFDTVCKFNCLYSSLKLFSCVPLDFSLQQKKFNNLLTEKKWIFLPQEGRNQNDFVARK